jgi:hypothetical protein
MDLGSITKKDLSTIELVMPNFVPIKFDDGTPMTITMNGLYSEKYRAGMDAQQSARLKRVQASGGKVTITPEEMREDRMSFVVSMVDSWHIQLDGEKPACTVKIIRDVFARLPFIYDQCDRALEDGQSFLETSSKHSSTT